MITNKPARIKQVTKIIQIVAKYHGTDPETMLNGSRQHSPKVKAARGLIMHHLLDCGVKLSNVSRMFQLSDSHTKDCANKARIGMSDDDRLLIATLPKVDKSNQTQPTP